MIEYIGPYFDIEINGNSIKKLNSLNYVSSRLNPVDVARIKIPTINNDFEIGQDIVIKLGYKNKGLWQLLKGKLYNVIPQKQIEFLCKDKMADLKNTKIKKTFRNCAPQDILQYSLNKAGINYSLSSKSFTKKHHFVSKNKDIITLTKLINQTWDLNYHFYIDEDTFIWGAWEESPRYSQTEIFKFEYGKNIINLKPNEDGTGIIKTVPFPFIKHSHLIKIIDKRFWKQSKLAKVDRIHINYKDDKGRCYIEWKELMN